jgi:hypothetical protein
MNARNLSIDDFDLYVNENKVLHSIEMNVLCEKYSNCEVYLKCKFSYSLCFFSIWF